MDSDQWLLSELAFIFATWVLALLTVAIGAFGWMYFKRD